MRSKAALPDLVIGDLRINPPIIQGGMGVLVSASKLASAVSNEGALGVIAAVGGGEEGPERLLGYHERSRLGLMKMVRKTRELTKNPIAVNIMCALTNYANFVAAADDAEVDVIISGAGLPLHLPGLVKRRSIKLIPVVSSARAADLICRTWRRKHNRLPDAIIVEGSAAGGHLGFSMDEIDNPALSLESIVKDVLTVAAKYPNEAGVAIPVIAAGGIFDGADIARFLKLGASGVQMGTRFVCTHECDASMAYKQAYLDCKKEDIIVIKSPVKLPLRVIRNSFIEKSLAGERAKFKCTYHCLATCEPDKSRYCVAQALKNSCDGDMEAGFATCGANAYRIDKIVSVHELIQELVEGCQAALDA